MLFPLIYYAFDFVRRSIDRPIAWLIGRPIDRNSAASDRRVLVTFVPRASLRRAPGDGVLSIE